MAASAERSAAIRGLPSGGASRSRAPSPDHPDEIFSRTRLDRKTSGQFRRDAQLTGYAELTGFRELEISDTLEIVRALHFVPCSEAGAKAEVSAKFEIYDLARKQRFFETSGRSKAIHEIVQDFARWLLAVLIDASVHEASVSAGFQAMRWR